MYEKDGEKYFIVDEHQHFWNARPDNWVEGRENLAKGWIDCFYGYHQLGPPETHWDMEKYQRWTVEDYSRTCSRRATSTTRCSSRPTSSTGTRKASTPSSATRRWPRPIPARSS